MALTWSKILANVVPAYAGIQGWSYPGSPDKMSDGTTTQMSENWINGRIEDSGLTDDQLIDLRQQLELRVDKVTFVKADVTGVNTNAPEGPGNGKVTFTRLIQANDNISVTQGGTWTP